MTDWLSNGYRLTPRWTARNRTYTASSMSASLLPYFLPIGEAEFERRIFEELT